MKFKYRFILASCLCLVLISGCNVFNEDYLEERPPHLISAGTLFESYEGFQSGLNGLYAEVRLELSGLQSNTAPRYAITMGGTDVLVTNLPHVGWSTMASKFGNELNPNQSWLSEWFAWVYGIVNAANTIIDEAEKREDVEWSYDGKNPEENRNLVIAEARAIRAWAYRHLSYLWGDVPLVLQPSSGSSIKTDWERSPVKLVREQMIEDFLFAEQYIPVERENQGRLTKGAVQHYLAETYLTLDEPNNALMMADKVINTPEYNLITERYGVRMDEPGTPFMDMFYDGNANREEGNSEALWVFPFEQFSQGGGVAHKNRHHASRYSEIVIDGIVPLQNTLERGGRGATICSLSKFCLGLWDKGDDRASEFAIRWFYVLKDAESNAPYPADRLPSGYSYGDTIWTNYEEVLSPSNLRQPNRPFSRKVEGTDPNNVSTSNQWNDQIYLRLADTYLLKAEAQYKLGDILGATETINTIRRRSNADAITESDIDIDFILDERARELIMEEHRRYTLIRNNKWIERTKAHNFHGGQFIEEKHRLMPIPQDVINTNLSSVFPQNPGY
ncbi:RagB/SusD family nutrient uptake outer membrane protein [Membranihabitans maritimus]|uniref:RagB/SusD family nutrient uptake outer membrane protein n=1 Tax=Membranihabitans maritimus TaxID=2904244 RepID=UPI001F2E29E5|nr:RagB/SusD family nutrient uptake outer membrane protein [Membranihabitans maritimus]